MYITITEGVPLFTKKESAKIDSFWVFTKIELFYCSFSQIKRNWVCTSAFFMTLPTFSHHSSIYRVLINVQERHGLLLIILILFIEVLEARGDNFLDVFWDVNCSLSLSPKSVGVSKILCYERFPNSNFFTIILLSSVPTSFYSFFFSPCLIIVDNRLLKLNWFVVNTMKKQLSLWWWLTLRASRGYTWSTDPGKMPGIAEERFCVKVPRGFRGDPQKHIFVTSDSAWAWWAVNGMIWFFLWIFFG